MDESLSWRLSDDNSPALPWVISASTEDALRARARQLRDHLDARPEWAVADVARALLDTPGGTGGPHRAVIVSGNREEQTLGLRA